MSGRLRPYSVRIDQIEASANDTIVNRILHERRLVRHAPDAFEVGLIFREEESFRAFAVKTVIAQLNMRGLDDGEAFVTARTFLDLRLLVRPSPAPGVSKPERRKNMQRCGLRSVVRGLHANEQVVRTGLGVFHFDIEKAILGEHASMPELELAIHPRATRAFGDELVVGKCLLRVAVDHPHQAVRRSIVVVPVNFFDIFAVVALRTG